jgi:UDP-3-O-[3-hydroxymyristoyl] N-acetylglucosamine deacetylase
MTAQRTIKAKVQTMGVGLHTGARVTLTLRPGAPDEGIIFHRTDLPEPNSFRISPELVVDTRLCSALECQGVKIATVEHLMSALAGLGIDNIHIDVDGPEIPILDGSASPFVYLLQDAGLVDQKIPKRYIRITRPVRVEEGDKWAEFTPYPGFKLSFSIEFEHPLFHESSRKVEIELTSETYIQEISRARTFGFTRDVEYLRTHGLALGGCLDNAIVLGDHQVLNNGGLRYADEFAKHKVLDAVGDLYLTGHPIIGAFTAHKSGHGLNNQLLRKLLNTSEHWVWQTDHNK